MINHVTTNEGDEWNKIEAKSPMAIVLDDRHRRILIGDFKPSCKIQESGIGC